MPGGFEPDEHQRRLIDEATRLAKRGSESIRFAPEQLVSRMTFEGQLVNKVDDESSSDGRDDEVRLRQRTNVDAPLRAEGLASEAPVCRVVLAAAVDAGEDAALNTVDIASRHRMANCVAATLFKVPRNFLVLQFDQDVGHRQAAMVASIEAVLRAFPGAEFIDLDGQNALIEELVDAAREMAPDQKQLQTMYSCTMPSSDAVALAAAAVEGFFSANPRAGAARLVEADVFEVLPDFGLAHLMTPGGLMLCITARTPGIVGIHQVTEGQRYRCWIQGRSNLVVRACLTD